MINKLTLQSAINKYHLGEIESVKWTVKDNTLSVDFMSLNKEIIGKLTYNNFTVEDCELAVFDTKKLLNLINITSGDLLISLEKVKSINTKLHIADNSYNLTYALADPLLIAKPGTVNEPEWDAVLPLEREFVDHLIKAKSALQGVDNMTITPTKDLNDTSVCIFSFGDEDGHNNRITYQMYGEIQSSDSNIPFNSDSFKNILNANKDLEEGTISINYGGLMKLCFKSEDSESEYFLIRKEQSAF
jgi:hypothetical protein